MYPEKLKKGDGIRIVSPATSMSAMSDENINAAKTKLEELGFCVSFSENAKEINEFHSSSIESVYGICTKLSLILTSKRF